MAVEFKLPPLTEPLALAIKAMAQGAASEGQQKEGLMYVIHSLCSTNALSYSPDAGAMAFSEGRRYVGLALWKIIQTPVAELVSQGAPVDPTQQALMPRNSNQKERKMKTGDRVAAVVPLAAFDSEDSLHVDAGEEGVVKYVPDEDDTFYVIKFSGMRLAYANLNDIIFVGGARE